MTEKVVTAPPNTNVAQAAKTMAKHGIGCVIIVKSKKPVGILTERDLLMKVVSHDLVPSKIRVDKIMSKPVSTITPDVDINEAARIMAQNKIRRLPVIQEGRLVGIITSSDFITIAPQLTEYVTHPEMPPPEAIEQSVCESCGELKTSLFEVNGMWVCEDCRDAMGR